MTNHDNASAAFRELDQTEKQHAKYKSYLRWNIMNAFKNRLKSGCDGSMAVAGLLEIHNKLHMLGVSRRLVPIMLSVPDIG